MLTNELELEKRAAEMNLVIGARIAALQFVAGAESCFALCRYAREREWFRLGVGPLDFRRWRALYRSKEIFDPSYAAPLLMRSTKGTAIQRCKEGWHVLEDACRTTRSELIEVLKTTTNEEWVEVLTFWREVETGFWEDYRDDLENRLEEDANLDAAFALPESMFFVMVAMPCLFEYGEPIGQLYERVLAGDFESLCSLIRLDKFALEQPEVRKQYDLVLQSRDVVRACRLLQAHAEPPTTSFSERATWEKVALLLFDTLADWDMALKPARVALEGKGIDRRLWPRAKLSYSRILDLFDAVIADRQRDDFVIAESAESFKMSLNRKRGFWRTCPRAA